MASYGNLSPVKAGFNFDEAENVGTPSTANRSPDGKSPFGMALKRSPYGADGRDYELTFSQAADSAGKKYDEMFKKKLSFDPMQSFSGNGSPFNSPGYVRGNRSLVVEKQNFSGLKPVLTELEQDEFLTFEEKYKVDHKAILGEGASC